MKTYTFVIVAGISLSTKVEAKSLEEAVEEAKSRSILSLCHGCANGSPREEWVTSGELDCDPSLAPLVDLFIDDEWVQGEEFAKAEELWNG